MSSKDYYAILGVKESAGQEEIKRAFKKLSFRHHPDKNRGREKEAEERFKEISEAYYVLGDANRRADYDAFRRGASYGQGQEFAGAAGFDFDELLRRFRTSEGSYRRRPQGFADIFQDIFGPFSGGYTTGREYTYSPAGGSPRNTTGHGFSHDTDVKAALDIPRALAEKGGEARFAYNGTKNISLTIPPHTPDGRKLRIKGQGRACPCCGHHGDLIVTVRIK